MDKPDQKSIVEEVGTPLDINSGSPAYAALHGNREQGIRAGKPRTLDAMRVPAPVPPPNSLHETPSAAPEKARPATMATCKVVPFLLIPGASGVQKALHRLAGSRRRQGQFRKAMSRSSRAGSAAAAA